MIMLTLLLLACADPVLDCTVDLAPDMPTVPVVSWTQDAAATGRVRYAGHVTADQGGARQRQLLPGLPPGTTVDIQAESELDGQIRSCAATVTTGQLPTEPPLLTVSTDETGDDAWFLATVYTLPGYASTQVIFDRSGQVVWAHAADPDSFVVDVQPALDGDGILYDSFDATRQQDLAALHRVGLDGAEGAPRALPQGHHMFAQLPDGTIAWQQFDVREGTDPSTGETESLVGDAIAELSPDGTVRTVFSAWDWVDVAHNRFMDLPSLYPQGVDWTHGNALKYLPEQDGYLLSLGNAGVVLQVDRTTDTPWQIVGNAGVPVADDSNPLEHQHDPTWLSDDRLLVFDSHFSTYSSGAVEYALQDGALHEVWRHGFQDGSFALLLGQALRQDDGSTLVNYGSAGVLEQVDADDRVQWRVELPAQTGFAQVRVLGSWGEGAFPGW